VTRTEYDGTITVIADGYRGSPLNSPNDIVAHSDGSVWFTDPSFGISGHYEGHFATARAADQRIPRRSRHARDRGRCSRGSPIPNGLAFSPDQSLLYVVECGTPRAIHAYDVGRFGAPPSQRPRADRRGSRHADGFAWTWTAISGAAGAWAPSARRRAHLRAGRQAHRPPAASRALRQRLLRRRKRNRLFMAASQSVYALYVNTQGVAYF
jgi:gluconolactonase